MKKKFFRVASMFLSLIVFITSLNLSFLVKAEGTNPSVYINPSNTQAIYTYDGYYVVFNLNGSWTGGHNVGIQIYNTGNETIEDWALESDYSNNISNIWNASVLENANGVTKFYHDTWNSVIYPNSCVEFGFSSNEDFSSFPSFLRIMGSEIMETESDLFSIDYTITDNWGEGYTGLITITNTSENVIRNWALDFSCNNENISVWNAKIESHEGNRVSVGNMGFNADINPGESVKFGFIVYNVDNYDEFYDYSLYESAIVSNESQEKELLIDIGENYVKDALEDDLDYDPELEMKYVKNQLIIDAYVGTPKEVIEEIVEGIDATIVGYVEVINDFQIEFNSAKTYEELDIISRYLESFSFIGIVTLNYVLEEGVQSTTDDEFYNDNFVIEYGEGDLSGNGYFGKYSRINKDSEIEEAWGEEDLFGDNWNLNILHIPSAWNYTSGSNKVKVGIYDNYFENDRRDGELVFDEIIGGNPPFNRNNYDYDHGTHVAGIIGATSNNGTGISGIANNVRMYGCSFLKEPYIFTYMNAASDYSKLIANNVRILNVSVGFDDDAFVCSASENNASARKKIKLYSSYIERVFIELVNSGYDFLIVSAAGNGNNWYYKEIGNNKYEIDPEKNESNKKNNINAKYGSFLNAIEDPRIKERIIVVGSIDKEYRYSWYCNVGERVDVCAPGDYILSTIPYGMNFDGVEDDVIQGFGLASGSSMAAPHISGIAALMLQVKPSLSAVQIKHIICDDSNAIDKIYDPLNFSHNLPNAELCVKAAINTNVSLDNLGEGIIAGSVKDNSNNAPLKAKITASRKNLGEYVLSSSCYSFETNTEGDYSYNLPEGCYDLIYSVEGYLPIIVNDVNINPEQTSYLNVSLVKWEKGIIFSGWINGNIIDAISGEAVSDATIRVRKGWNNYSDDYISDEDGNAIRTDSNRDGSFELLLPVGNYTIEIMKNNYIIGYFNSVSTRKGVGMADGITCALSPVLPENEYRIILTWDDSPRDLDSHLTYNTDEGQQFHVYFGSQSGSYNDVEIATLDLDDTSGYGPETITITVDSSLIGSGEFRYSVHNFSNEAPISQSNAIVRVYKGNTLMHDPIYAPNNISENVWYVFSITQDGICLKNEHYNSSYNEVQ